MTISSPAPGSNPTGLRGALRSVDDILRGHHTRETALAAGAVPIAYGTLLRLVFVLGAVYGASLGAYGLFQGGDQPWLQLLSASLKLPFVFLLTLVVTFPSLYVFGALFGSTLGRGATLRLLLVVSVVHAAVLASLGPVFVFFAASTKSYAFLLLLNVAFALAGGLVSLTVLRGAQGVPAPAVDADGPRPGGRLPLLWCAMYGAVGAQMGWLLRPFLGAPGHAFAWLRERDSSFFETVIRTLGDLFRA